METRIQFSLSNALWVITWTAVWCASWTFGVQLIDATSPQSSLPDEVRILLVITCWTAFVGTPFAAFGALIGRMKLGMIFGVMMALGAALALWRFLSDVQ